MREDDILEDGAYTETDCAALIDQVIANENLSEGTTSYVEPWYYDAETGMLVQ